MSIYFSSDVDIVFWSGCGEGFELGVEYEFGSYNGSIVDIYIKRVIDVDIGDSLGWGGFGIDDNEEVELWVKDDIIEVLAKVSNIYLVWYLVAF